MMGLVCLSRPPIVSPTATPAQCGHDRACPQERHQHIGQQALRSTARHSKTRQPFTAATNQAPHRATTLSTPAEIQVQGGESLHYSFRAKPDDSLPHKHTVKIEDEK